MLAKFTIRTRLFGSFGFVLLLMALMAGAGVVTLRSVESDVSTIRDNWLASIDAVNRYRGAALEVRRAELALAAYTDPEVRQRRAREIEGVMTALQTHWRDYEPLISSAEERRMADRTKRLEADVLSSHAGLMRAVATGSQEAIVAAIASGRAAFDQHAAAAMELVDYNRRGADITANEAYASIRWGETLLLVSAAISLLFGGAMAWAIARGIAGRTANLSVALDRLARRDYAFDLAETKDGDEIGAMARALDACRDGLREADRLATQQQENERRAAERASRIETLVQSFEAEATAVLRTVSAAATELSATASSMSETAEDGTRQATVVAAASEQASVNVQTVAASTEELAASIAEVARQVRDTAGITNRAADAARDTDSTVRGLAEAANKIGDVVRLISDIAGQTNLLALNATIEAARAGEAGKGFAVVASEVKNLATQTAKATEEIAAQINAMQTETGRTVEAIAAIARTIEELNANTAQVAAASEQQAAATQEIGRAVAEAAQGTQEASRSAIGVKEGAERTGGAAQDLRGASTELAEQSERLRGQVDGFLAGIRAA
ncbi:methyl-accepting chemotaxis protein [Roseomonas fluvialis]|uniref:Chemotaxis protein n=1 Tax=Roseomonas fluvialis TaxID=1750527 RepID=A0ABM7XZW8_9PROT|nr:methyl-accepting chemotaxis protein [Roseomonas fluvialis]BDG71068.1 chemotaxis protein [Roseomonas fluvialis]